MCFFKILAVLVRVWWYLVGILICISLKSNDDEDLF